MSESNGRKAARDLCSRTGYAVGGHFGRRKGDDADDAEMVESGVHQHESGMHKGEAKTKLKLADGGYAGGGTSPSRADRSSRRGKDHDAPRINILVSPRHPGEDASAQLPPNAVPPPPPHPAAGPPGGMPPGGPPPGMPPGMPPGGPPSMPAGAMPRPMRAGGGVGSGTKHMTAGSGSGQGRQQKSKNLPY